MDKLHDELIAYLEDDLSLEARTRVELRIASDGAYRAELDWLRAAYADLDAVVRADAPEMPSIDIVDAVLRSMQKVNGLTSPVSLATVRASRSAWWKVAAGIAAVAILYVGYEWWRTSGRDDSVPGRQIAAPSSGPEATAPPVVIALPETFVRQKEKLDQKREDVHRRIGVKPDTIITATAGPRIELPGNVTEVAAARRDVAGGANMDRLLQWASLSKSKAMEVALAPDATPQAMVGAAESLGGEEARRILLTAVGKLPEDPASRLQLARAIAEEETPDTVEAAQNDTQAVAQLTDVKNIDPGNALPYYYEAKIRLDENNAESALQSLELAANMGKASAYSLESALAQAEALIAGGMDPEAARLVSALTAGVEENKFLCQLASDLLDYGQVFLSANDTQTAENIFRAVEQMGRQVEEGATFSQEQLAGMDIQAQALDAMGALYATIESVDGVSDVTASIEALTGRIGELDTFFTALDALFTSSMTEEFWNEISDLLLSSGDLTLLTQRFETPSVPAPSTP
ncbi:MAG: hypothetical protein SGI88_19165 [Candidatus Hydrogenedentes bacterium]|nr:hypothetical protein [Candidatus Hydrogenedentota bacterium]